MKRILKGTSLTTITLLSGLLFSLPRLASAQLGAVVEGIVGVGASWFVIPIAMLLSYIVNQIIGIAFSVASYLVELALAINDLILTQSNSLVQVGWGIARDLANLGFVLIIIVIAFATILRIERYGSQKLLVRLIAAAILVNFSLAIAGVVISFTSTISHFFLDFILGDKAAGFRVADIISGAFSPQRFLIQDPNPLPPDPSAQAGLFTSLSTATLVSIADLIFGGVFMLIATVVMATLALMLLIRYIMLSFLLVVSPITWLFWVIPDLQGQFTKWWSKFLEWAFFAPAVSFFIYLSIIAAEKLGEMSIVVNSDFVFPALANTIMQGAQMILLAGIMLGGLIAAKNMGIAGAGGAISLMNKGKSAALGWAGRQARRAGARTLESKPTAKLAGFMQRTPGLRRMGMALGGQADILRRGLVDDADKQIKKYSDAHIAKNLDTLSEPERVAALERLAKNDTMGLIKDRAGNGNVLSTISAENKKVFERFYGEGTPKWKSVELGSGMNVATADAIRANDVTRMRNEMKEWVKGLKPEQIGKLPVNDIFNGKDDLAGMGFKVGDIATAEAFRIAVVNAVAQNVPGDIAKLFKNVKSAGFDKLYNTTQYVRDFIEPADAPRAQKITDAMSRIASVRLYEGGGGAAAAAAAPTAAPAGPPTP